MVTGLDSVKKIGNKFNQKDLSIINTPQRNELIVEKYKEKAGDRRGLIFTNDINHCVDLHDAFVEGGFTTSFIVSDTALCPDREQRLADFYTGKTQIMVNVNILVEGYDNPDIGCVVLARPTMSKVAFTQMVGRTMRLKSDKVTYKDALILDIVDNTSKHNLINTETIEKGNTIEDKIFIPEEEKISLIKLREENQRRLELEIAKDQHVELFKVPEVKISGEWMKDDCTLPQIKYLKILGYDTENNVYTKGMARKIISSASASKRQIAEVRSYGYDVSGGICKGQYAKILIEHKKRDSAKKAVKKGRYVPFRGIN